MFRRVPTSDVERNRRGTMPAMLRFGSDHVPLCMLTNLRHSPLAPSLRRLIAVMLGLCMSVVFAEPLIADRCEDVGSRTTVGTSAEDGSTQVSVIGVDPGSRPGGSQVPDGHTMHLCHCTHVHGGTLTARHTMPARLEAVASAVGSHSDRVPPSVVGEPQLRPPRALIA